MILAQQAMPQPTFFAFLIAVVLGLNTIIGSIVALRLFSKRQGGGALSLIVVGVFTVFLFAFGVLVLSRTPNRSTVDVVIADEPIEPVTAQTQSESNSNPERQAFAEMNLDQIESAAPTPPKPLSNQWLDLDSDTFSANVYPSIEATVSPLAAQVRSALVERELISSEATADETASPTTIVVYEQEPSMYRHEFADEFALRLGRDFPRAEISVGTSRPEKVNPGTLLVRLHLEYESPLVSYWDSSELQQRGRHVCHLQMEQVAETAMSLQLDFVEKPWVESFDRFVSEHPLMQFMVGYSDPWCASEEEARRSALENARKAVAVSVDGVTLSYINEAHVVDRFAQKLSRSYGDVWREAVLIDVPPNGRAVAVRVAKRENAQRQVSTQMKFIGILVLLAVAFALCGLINWMTQGYYRTQIVLWIAVFGIAIVTLLNYA